MKAMSCRQRNWWSVTKQSSVAGSRRSLAGAGPLKTSFAAFCSSPLLRQQLHSALRNAELTVRTRSRRETCRVQPTGQQFAPGTQHGGHLFLRLADELDTEAADADGAQT